jgi:DNA polymerase-3 subunit gamma/tau
MAYLVTARKWRPMVFEDIVGQSHITTTLRNAISSGRLSHAYIFSGPRGVGKTTTARILAKVINCEHPKDTNPDNACDLCQEITDGRSVNVFEIDGASNRGIDEIRNLREAVRYGPVKGKYKVYIIDEVHMLTKEAFNALLKTLEEPPAYVLFIFATTEVQKVPLTILSRCQRFDFRRIPIDEIIARLRFISSEERIDIDDDALFLIARQGDGSLRDAKSVFDQVVSFSSAGVRSKDVLSMLNIVGEEIFFRATDIIRKKDVKAGLLLVDEMIRLGYDIGEFLTGLTEHLRNMLIVLTTESTSLIEASDVFKNRYMEHAKGFSEGDLLRLIRIADDTAAAVRRNQQPRLRLEVGLLQMIKLDSSIELSALLRQLDELKKKLDVEKEPLVRGSVKASQPVLRPDQLVERELPDKQPAAGGEDTLVKWSLLVDEARRERIAVGTLLTSTTVIEAKDDHLCIGCPDDFHLDALNLKRNHLYIQSLVQKIYGAKVRLETILAGAEPGPDGAGQREPKAVEHPLLQTIIREFGARQIP